MLQAEHPSNNGTSSNHTNTTSTKAQTTGDDPVILLHSSLSNRQQWSVLTQTFNKPIALDLLGYGQSPMPKKSRVEFCLADELTILEETLTEQNTALFQQPFHLVGHSYGAAVSLQIAKRYPDKILSLSLFEPVAFHLLEENSPALAEIQQISQVINTFLAQDDIPAATAYFIDYWNQPGTFERLSQNTQKQFLKGINKVAYDFHALLHEKTQLSELSHIQCPVQLLEGRHSPITTRTVISALAKHFPKADIHRLDCGHMGPITHAHLVNPVITEFIAAHNKA